MRQVTGFVPPIATPMRDGALDLDSLRREIDYLAEHVSGFLVGGSVGEHPNLTLEEREATLRVVARHKAPGHFLAASIADNCLENSRRLAAVAGELGADVLMVSCPNYYTNDRAMLTAYFARLGDLVGDQALCLYDNPTATRTQLSVADIEAIITACPRVTHIKVTDPAPAKVTALRERTRLTIHAGDDIVLWHMLSRGADGAMVALPMIYPEVASTVWRRLQADDLAGALAAYRQASHFIHIALGSYDYVQVIKTVLHHRGVIASPESRLPLAPLSPTRREEVLAAL